MTSKKVASTSVSGMGGDFTATLTGLDPTKTYYYVAYALVDGTESYADSPVEFKGESKTFLTGSEPSVVVTTAAASGVSAGSAVLAATFSSATSVPSEVGFYWGTASNNLTNKVTATMPSGTSGSFTVNVSGLAAGTTYYYKAYAIVAGTGHFATTSKQVDGSVTGFATLTPPPAGDVDTAISHCGWLEMPSDPRVKDADNFVDKFTAASARNYSYLYDKSMYTTMWAAYPVYPSLATDAYSYSSWKANPHLDDALQINIWSGSYGVDYAGEFNNTIYSRGHLVPDASRDGNYDMLKETYYATNQVPQIQNNFNGGIWSSLEGAIRGAATSDRDTVYVVTGVAFSKVGENKAVTYIEPQHDTKDCPVPNYFYKVALKVKRSSGSVTSAEAIGFWFEHKQYAGGTSYSTYAVSVDQIEQWTGMDYFVNLPDGVENTAESNESWSSFQGF